MIGTGLAILGAGVLGAGASMFAANSASNTQANAAREAAGVQREAMGIQRDVLDSQRQNYGDASRNLNPYITGGAGASNLLQSFYGINGDQALGQSALERFRQSPDYQFARSEGLSALDNSAAARGGAMGGNQMRAIADYGSGLATQNLGNYLSRLSGMAGQGIQAGGYLGQMGTNLGTGISSAIGTSANNVGNSIMGAGTAEASGTLGMARGFQGGLSALQQYNDMSRSSYAPGGGFLNSGSWGQSNPGIDGSAFYGPTR